MHDSTLTPLTRMVGYEIACHLNRVSGQAWPSQETIRKRLGVKNIRTIKRGIRALKNKKYIAVAFNPNARSNSYVACFTEVDGYISGTKMVVPASPRSDSKAPFNGDKIEGEWGQNQTANSDTRVPLSSKEEPQKEKGAVSPTNSTDQNIRRWQSVKNRLAIVLGANIVASWFDKITVELITESEVVLQAPTRFVRSYIESGYLGDRLTEEWRRAIPTLRNVRLLHGPSETTAKPS